MSIASVNIEPISNLLGRSYPYDQMYQKIYDLPHQAHVEQTKVGHITYMTSVLEIPNATRDQNSPLACAQGDRTLALADCQYRGNRG